MVRLGTARRIITPPLGIYLAGYGDRKGGCSSVRDNLTATAMVWEKDDFRAAVVCLDLLGINQEIVRRIRAAVEGRLKINALELCCSHTHSGPIGWAPERISPGMILKEALYRVLALPAGLSQPSGWRKNKKYIDSLVKSAAEAVLEASEKTEPVELFTGKAPLRLGINRRQKDQSGRVTIGRNPEGSSPKNIRVLQAVSKQKGLPLLTLINYDCHGVFLGPASYAVSADWIGEMRGLLEENGPGLYAFIQGGSGNINPEAMAWGLDEEGLLKDAGKTAAAAVSRALENKTLLPEDGSAASAGEIIIPAGINLSAAAKTMAVIKEPAAIKARAGKKLHAGAQTYAGGRAIHHYRTALAEKAGMPRWIVDPVLHFRYPWKTEINIAAENNPAAGSNPPGPAASLPAAAGSTALNLASPRLSTPIRVSYLKIGGFSLGSLSMEPFFETAERVREMLPGFSMFAGYTNGLTGYLPTAEAASEGGYEVEDSPYFYRLPGLLEENTEAKVLEAFTVLTAEKKKPRISIRRAGRADSLAVAHICQRTFFGGPDFPYPELVSLRWADWYTENSEHCFVAADERDIPGGYILCAADSTAYCRSFRETIVPRIRAALSRLKAESPRLYKKYRPVFLPVIDEYRLPRIKRIVKTYPAHLHMDLLPEFQKMGLGGALMRRLLEHLRENNIPGVHLIVGRNNRNAVGFYESQGFKILTTLGWGLEASYVMGLKFPYKNI